MPRYFIDKSDGDSSYIDDVGTVLPDDEAARKAALAALPDMVRGHIPDGDQRRFVVTVRNETREVIYNGSMSFTGTWQKQAAAADDRAERVAKHGEERS